MMGVLDISHVEPTSYLKIIDYSFISYHRYILYLLLIYYEFVLLSGIQEGALLPN